MYHLLNYLWIVVHMISNQTFLWFSVEHNILKPQINIFIMYKLQIKLLSFKLIFY